METMYMRCFRRPPKAEAGSENQANGMSLKEFEEHNKRLVKNSNRIGLRSIKTQKINYVLYDYDKPIGSIALRPEPNKYWREHSGHIGFSVRPTERGKHYGTKMLGLVLLKAKEYGLKKVSLQCNNMNIASQKVIESNDGIKVKEDESIYYDIYL